MLKQLFLTISLLLISTLTFSKNLYCLDSINPELQKSLSTHKIKFSSKTLTDYANIKHSDQCYLVASPKNTAEVSALVKFAYQHNIPIRIQGNSHSENTSSLPKYAELLIHTDNLNSVRFTKPGQITAGAGIPIALLNEYIIKSSDYTLPVLNGGGIGPTVGGFFSAGGISHTSEKYGGFWNHVREVTIVTGNGKVHSIKQDDPLFPWLFGSMGQLGVITETKLDLIPTRENPAWPENKRDHITYKHENYFSHKHHPLYWFNLFVTPEQRDLAREALTEFQSHHPEVLNYIPIYEWSLKNNRFVPPLIFPGVKTFHALGTWGTAGPHFDTKKLAAMEKEFGALVIKNHYHRYIQAELANKPSIYSDYFGPGTYQAFYEIKLKLDPGFLFNQNTVFNGVKSQGTSYAIH